MNFFYNEKEENIFFVRTNLSDSTIDSLVSDAESVVTEDKLSRASIGLPGEENVRRDTRWLMYGSLPLSFWGSLILKSALLEANDRFFKFDLSGWSDTLQYLRYQEGEHYKAWHKDTRPSLGVEGHIRKLTVLLSLSDPLDYEGGEFCYYNGHIGEKIKFQKGEIAIFPACLMHRVTPIKSGTRKMLIGWYGGPPFK